MTRTYSLPKLTYCLEGSTHMFSYYQYGFTETFTTDLSVKSHQVNVEKKQFLRFCSQNCKNTSVKRKRKAMVR